jgi:hypothetical protein
MRSSYLWKRSTESIYFASASKMLLNYTHKSPTLAQQCLNKHRVVNDKIIFKLE